MELGEFSLQGLEYNDGMCMTPWGCYQLVGIEMSCHFWTRSIQISVYVILYSLVCCAWKYSPSLFGEIIF